MPDEAGARGAATKDKILHGGAILDAVKAAGVEIAVTLPDIWTADGILWNIASEKHFRQVKICKEDEGFGICSGLAFCGKRSMLFMQFTGLLDCVNALRVVGMEFEQPICMLVGLLNKEPDVPSRQSKNYGVRIVEPVLDAMEVKYVRLDTDADLARIGPAVDEAYATSRPVVFLVERKLVP